MISACFIVGTIAGITESVGKEKKYQELCKEAEESGKSRPERVVIKQKLEDPKEQHSSFWPLVFAVLIGANL